MENTRDFSRICIDRIHISKEEAVFNYKYNDRSKGTSIAYISRIPLERIKFFIENLIDKQKFNHYTFEDFLKYKIPFYRMDDTFCKLIHTISH